MPRHRRRSIRLPGYDYASPGAYFITVCVQDRLCLLGEIEDGEMVLSEVGRVVEAVWQRLPAHVPHIALDAFVVMPNHVHGIVCIVGENDGRGEAFAGRRGEGDRERDENDGVRSDGRGDACVAPTGRVHRSGPAPGSLGAIVGSFKSAATREIRRRGLAFAWQRNYFERVLRGERELHAARAYIQNNPLRWHLDRLHPDRWRPDAQPS